MYIRRIGVLSGRVKIAPRNRVSVSIEHRWQVLLEERSSAALEAIFFFVSKDGCVGGLTDSAVDR
jgi:hypothetical protein